MCERDVVIKGSVDRNIYYDFNLLDEYDQFLYTGQGKLIREYRERMGLQKKPFARRLGIDPRTFRGWENETIRVKRGSWERYFKENIEIS